MSNARVQHAVDEEKQGIQDVDFIDLDDAEKELNEIGEQNN